MADQPIQVAVEARGLARRFDGTVAVGGGDRTGGARRGARHPPPDPAGATTRLGVLVGRRPPDP
ncbi:hypothetical protein AB0L06_14795, partial [Spirillospora sp. NPDC052269]